MNKEINLKHLYHRRFICNQKIGILRMHQLDAKYINIQDYLHDTLN